MKRSGRSVPFKAKHILFVRFRNFLGGLTRADEALTPFACCSLLRAHSAACAVRLSPSTPFAHPCEKTDSNSSPTSLAQNTPPSPLPPTRRNPPPNTTARALRTLLPAVDKRATTLSMLAEEEGDTGRRCEPGGRRGMEYITVQFLFVLARVVSFLRLQCMDLFRPSSSCREWGRAMESWQRFETSRRMRSQRDNAADDIDETCKRKFVCTK